MIRVRTGSRLHFGLLNPGAAESLVEAGGGIRRYGGAGLMVEKPCLSLSMQPAQTWSAHGPLSERALSFVDRFLKELPDGYVTPQCVTIEQAPPEHAGFGVGTQLGLAVGRALACLANEKDLTTIKIARRVGRGRRSGIGVHGFDLGGFLVEAGKYDDDSIAPLVTRVAFPDSWSVVLVLPSGQPGLHGEAEAKAFKDLQTNITESDYLCSLVLLRILPALIERDIVAFGEALHEFNMKAGKPFALEQGGVYANARVADVVAFVRANGIKGVGQSSWGPAVFAITADVDQACYLANLCRRHCALEAQTVMLTRARNAGAETRVEIQ
ncbi:MAG: beta-ribofuranosylaminobenzene 5'-phosphate synthase family protein [Gemmataceae bacterium]